MKTWRIICIVTSVMVLGLMTIPPTCHAEIRSTPVTIVNPDTNPVPTTEALPREPWQRELTFSIDPTTAIRTELPESIVVPADRRLVVELITVSGNILAVELDYFEFFALTVPELLVQTTANGTTVAHEFPIPRAFTGSTSYDGYEYINKDFFKTQVSLRLHADPSSTIDVTVVLRRQASSGKFALKKCAEGDCTELLTNFKVTMSGYLIPADSASLAP